MELFLTTLVAFATVIFLYHSLDFAIQYYYNPSEITWDCLILFFVLLILFISFFFPKALLLSREYVIAMSFAVIEFIIESLLFPQWKHDSTFASTCFFIGLAGALFGDGLRKIAMITAKEAFTHLIQYKKRDEHLLVTWGVYKFFRHPGYFGWFVWAPSTQILLRNPISFLLFVYAAWKFFSGRIRHEEKHLIKMFGDAYVQYRARTPTWIPLVP